MILVLGSRTESVVDDLYLCLKEQGAQVITISPADIPGTVTVTLNLTGTDMDGHFTSPDSGQVVFKYLTGIYNRFGFTDFEVFTEYTQEEVDFVNSECSALLSVFLNHARCPVINRPYSSSSNASKPYQISLIQHYGFKVPLTLVSNEPARVREFYEQCGGKAVYKSISYTRSLVQKLEEKDLERLNALAYTPIQVQQFVEGSDVRVHVVGDRTFASAITSEKSDYRYDRQVKVEALELPAIIASRCVALASGLGLVLAGIDLRCTPSGDYYCFEVNPSPVFTWYEHRTGQPITKALGDLLMSG
jgi:glutathione synthase/RimK-type ligase-like ATP-grasp enzyme